MLTPEIHWIAILPELILAVGAAVVLLVEVQWKPRVSRLGLIAAVASLLAFGFTILQWVQAEDAVRTGFTEGLIEFSGMILTDGFAIFSRFVLIAIMALSLLAGWRFIESLGRRGAEAIALVLLATTGFSIMVASNNLVMMFLGLEVGSIALYVLAGMTRDKTRSDEAAMKYFLLGSFASAIFIYGVALLYAGTGQFEVLAMRGFFQSVIVTTPAVILIGMGLVIVGLGFKVSAAPFHTWAPDVYEGAPAGITGYMAAMAKIAGFAAIGRILITGLPQFDQNWMPVLAGIAVASMLIGSVVALVQQDIRRMLAYSGIAHAGFIMTGVVGGATAGMLFYVTVYAIQLVGAFAIVASVSGSDSSSSGLDEYRGLAKRSPVLAVSFAVLLLGMAGLPLTSGFVAKFGVFTEAWVGGYSWLVIAGLLLSVVAFAFYMRVIVVMFMDDAEGDQIVVAASLRWAVGIAAVSTIVIGIVPGPLLRMAANAFPL
jgi:NADH-quinone oxidoreductase subunit N